MPWIIQAQESIFLKSKSWYNVDILNIMTRGDVGCRGVIGMVYRGIVKGRMIELSEEPPFPEGAQVEISVSMPIQAREAETALKFAGMLEDMTDQEQTLFEEALKRRPTFARRIAL
jgi:hypothetical protein